MNVGLDVRLGNVKVRLDKAPHNPNHPSFSWGGGVRSREHEPIEVHNGEPFPNRQEVCPRLSLW